jgi:hypothetical protein
LNYFLTTYYIWQKYIKEHTKEPNTKPEPENTDNYEHKDEENKNEAAPQPKQPKPMYQVFC